MKKPFVSIICTAYNHEKYIARCIEGFLSQKTNFSYEILINDDASTDQTAAIIKSYEDKYPQIIKPLYQKENQYSKRIGIWRTILFPKAQGKYIALCEGDDYWINPLKLQKQVDFLDDHLDYILTCGGFRSIKPNQESKDEILAKVVNSKQEDELGFSFTLEDCNYNWITKTLTLLFRNSTDLPSFGTEFNQPRDIHLIYYLLKKGKGYYFKTIFGIYNMHQGGIYSLKPLEEKLVTHYYIYKDMYEKSPDEFTRVRFLMICQDLINLKISLKMEKGKISAKSLFKRIRQLIKKRKEYINLIKCFVPIQIKSLYHKR